MSKFLSKSILATIGAISLGSSQVALAAACTTYYCNAVLIKALYVEAGGQAHVGLDTPLTPLNCASVGGAYLTLNHTPGSEKLYSLLLTAHQQQSPVDVRINEGSTGCTLAYVVSQK